MFADMSRYSVSMSRRESGQEEAPVEEEKGEDGESEKIYNKEKKEEKDGTNQGIEEFKEENNNKEDDKGETDKIKEEEVVETKYSRMLDIREAFDGASISGNGAASEDTSINGKINMGVKQGASVGMLEFMVKLNVRNVKIYGDDFVM